MGRPSLATVELCLRLPLSQATSVPEVRLLVDLESTESLHSEIEVALQADSSWTFRGSFVVEHPCAASLIYRLGICAPSGTLWTLSIRDAKDRCLLRDADTLDAPKSWLVGSCPLGSLADHGQVVRLADYRRRRAGGAGRG